MSTVREQLHNRLPPVAVARLRTGLSHARKARLAVVRRRPGAPTGTRRARGERAVLRTADVVDGRHLNVSGILPGAVAQGLIARLTGPAGEVRTGAARVVVPAPGVTTHDFAALIDLEPDGTPMAAGWWQLDLIGESGRGLTVLNDVVALEDDGPTLWNPPSPTTGYRYRPSARHRHAGIRSRPAKPTAQVVHLRTVPDGLRIAMTTVGPVHDAVGVLATERDGTGRIELPLATSEPGDESTVDAVVVVPARRLATPEATPATWDLHLIDASGASIRVGYGLSDLRSPRTAIRWPQEGFRRDDGQFAMLRPYLTISHHLAVEVSVADERATASPSDLREN